MKKIPDVTSLITKTDFDTKLKKISDRVTSNKSKHLLVKNEQKKLKTFDLSYFKGKKYFEGNDGPQNALVFKTMQKHFDLSNVSQISKCKSKGLSNQDLDAVGTLGDVVLTKPIKPMHVIFKGKGTLVNSNFVFKNCLFGAIKITNTTNSDTDKWQYSGYGIGFDSKGKFTHPDGGDGKNVIVFGADLGNSRHATNKTQSALILGHGLIQKINDTTIYAEKI